MDALYVLYAHHPSPYCVSFITPSSGLPMASTANTSSNFESILDTALSDYTNQTGIDLATHPSAQTLQNCNSADAILELLGDKARQFQAYRDGNRKLINCLKPVVQILHAVSSILDGATAMVSLPNQLILTDRVLTVPLSRYRFNRRKRSLSVLMFSSLCV